MENTLFCLPPPVNEPVLDYAPGSTERHALDEELERQSRRTVEIPLIIGGQSVLTGRTGRLVMPHRHNQTVAIYHLAGEAEIRAAVDAARKARQAWMDLPWLDRAAILMRAADLIAGKYRARLNAAAMLGQSKSIYQAEIDVVCECADFLRFNCHFACGIYSEQPQSAPGQINHLDYRPLEGFVFALSPFNFASIALNLASAPALMGNTVIWKPATTALLSNHYLMQILQEAGLPPGVINFLPGVGEELGRILLDEPELSGIHFTGATATFRSLWRRVGENIDRYRSFPRLVGETGGKDFVFAHASADAQELATALVRGAFEYQGQKCSAASRAYIPASLWPDTWASMQRMLAEIHVGDVRDPGNFMGALIDEKAFDTVMGAIRCAAEDPQIKILHGGRGDKGSGYFIEPTVLRTADPFHFTMQREIFGPLLAVYVYEDERFAETLELCDRTSPYGLTGSIFGRDRLALVEAARMLRYTAGNFYINDKPTGAVVGRQPFGGARASGTNDKSGSPLNLRRWVSPRAVKETLAPPDDFRYPFMTGPAPERTGS